MGFGFNAKVEAPKVEVPKVAVPKVEAPKIDIAGAVGGAAAGLKSAVSGAAAGVAAGAKGAVGGALGAVGKVAAASLSGVAGALAEVAVSFKGAAVDFAMEPHMVLDANASYGDTQFEKGPVWIRVDLAPEQAKASTDTLHLFSDSGEYDRKEGISSFKEENGKTVDVVFEDAPMDQSFSLEVINERGQVHSIFAHVTYGDLRKTKNRY